MARSSVLTVSRRFEQVIVLAALLFSGVAAIINQVIWQRALKIFLGGSETMSSLVVVLVFMLGLGIGSGLTAKRAPRSGHPLRAFGCVELGLFAINVAIAILLSMDLTESIYAAERLAFSAGIPIRLIYGIGALGLLLPPTVLMGATLPLAAEACQRQLGATERSLITVLFALNTFGSCIGAGLSSFCLLPYYGQRMSLVVAAGFNLLAAISVLLTSLRIRTDRSTIPDRLEHRSDERWHFSLEEKLGTALGFLALGYEIFLLRLVSLAHQPLPYTFAFTLLFYLLFWSAGVWVAGRIQERLPATLLITAGFIVVMPWIFAFDRNGTDYSLFTFGLIYFVPCIGFGLLYGALVSRSSSEWGRDVGRFYSLNTVGSCCGIVVFTLVGYEVPQNYNAFIIALGLIVLLLQLIIAKDNAHGPSSHQGMMRIIQAAVGVVALGILASGLSMPFSEADNVKTFWGRDGVVEIDEQGDVWIDGLWHSRLSDGDKSHIGSPYSWMLATAAVMAHRDEPIQDALVVGNGVGLTASTLAKMEGLHVDAYEINSTLKRVLDLYPKRTLHVGTNPNINIRWTDGRSGLALDPKEYDLIISAPLYLRQAGSSILLSKEYMRLARARLKRHGVFALYSHEGSPAQAALVYATVRSVFDYMETFHDGLLTVASDTPIEISEEGIMRRLQSKDPLLKEMALFDQKGRVYSGKGIYDYFDADGVPIQESDFLITDDHPLVEYPEIASRLVHTVSDQKP